MFENFLLEMFQGLANPISIFWIIVIFIINRLKKHFNVK